MESAHFQTAANAKPLESSIRKQNHSTNVTNISSITNNSITNSTLVNNSNAQSANAGIAGGGESSNPTPTIINNQKLTTTVQNSINNSTLTSSSANQIITTTPAAISQVMPNGQATTVQQQQIIQVSSQAGSIVPGQQLMVQTLSGRPAIQLRTQGGQQFQQIQLIPFSNLQGQTQRPVIIQQTPGNVLHSTSGTITSMANLATHNVAKLNSTSLNNSSSTLSNSTNLNSSATNLAHQKPVIIQQATGSNQFIHSSTAQTHGIHHNVTKIATVGRATTANRPQQTAGATSNKMVLGHLTNSNNNSSSHQVQNHLAQQSNAATVASLGNSSSTAAAVVNAANPQQVTRLNIISSLPSVHTSVSNVAQQHSGANKPILSLAALGNKPLIINPASNIQNVQPSTIVGNVVNMSNLSNFANTHQLKQANASTNIIPTVMTLTTLTTSSNSIPGRHTMITSTTNHLQLNNSNTNANSLNLTQLASSAHNSQTLHQQPNQILTNHQSSATMRSNLLNPTAGSSVANASLSSPIKQIPQQTPSSPRPSILIRKRVGTTLDLDSKSNYQSINSSVNSSNNLQINSVKQNLSLKYNSPTVNSTVMNQSSINLSNIKVTQDHNKQQQTGVLNLKKQNLDSNQTIKNENESQFTSNSSSKQPLDAIMNNTNDLNNQNNQITPRKRRKQLLEPFMLSSQNIKILNDDSNSANNLLCNEDLLMKKKDQMHFQATSKQQNISQHTICRRPRPSLLGSYNLAWKSLQYHFLRYTEVKVKSEKKGNLTDLTNETLKKRNGWKVNHLSVQLEDVLKSEISFNQKLKELSKLYSDNKNNLPDKVKELGSQPFNAKVCHNSITVLDKLNDLFAANIQRSNLLHDQIKDTNSILNRLSNDHNDKVGRLTKKFLNKRNASVKT